MFSHFGIAGEALVGDIGFDHPQSAKDWATSIWGNPVWSAAGAGMDVSSIYRPLAPEDLARVRAQWVKLSDLVELQAPSGPRAEARLNSLRAELLGKQLIPHIDAITQSQDYASSGPQASQMSAGARERAGTYNVINARLLSFANESWPDAAEEIEAADAATAAAVALQAKKDAEFAATAAANAARAAQARAAVEQSQSSIAAAQAAIAAANQAKAQADAAAAAHLQAKTNAAQKGSGLGSAAPWLLGALVLAAGGAAFFARRKKHLAGYRRRSRR